jgi:hypothetical protein
MHLLWTNDYSEFNTFLGFPNSMELMCLYSYDAEI